MISYDSLDPTELLFEQAVKQVQTLNFRPTDSELLLLYGLYKQATVGNNRTQCPGFTDFKGKSKWSAWASQSGKGCSRARKEYITFVKELVAKYGEQNVPPV
jgi:diazepam-binding inhibitor (GABA receptor modulating acyl-CoA-binding protein)